MLPCAPPSRVYATAPMPANASGASDTCPAQPVSGTSESASSAVHMPSAMRFVLVGSCSTRRTRRASAMKTTNTAMPIAVSRTDDTRSTRRTALDARELDLGARQQQQHDEEHDRRQRVGHVGPAIGELEERAHPLRREREDQRAEIGQRQAAQPADDRGRERGDDQERERRGRHVGRLRREQDAGERGERTAERPREAREHRRARAAERGEIAVVDDGAHRDADPRPEQQDAQPDRERDRDHDRDEAVPREQRRRRCGSPGPANSCGIECASFWFQIMFARPMNANIRPTVTMSCTTRGLPCRCRMIARSSAMPEQRRDDEHDERQHDRPAAARGATVSSQSTYARNMPIAPCAKLKMPVVV